jgi:two-component system sensor histidine kinase ChiS
MTLRNEDENSALRILEKENKILKRKLERSLNEREELENFLSKTRKLLETVAAERLTEEVQKQLTMFRKFVPQEFLQSLNKEDWLEIKLGDHVEYEMTVLFTDIRSYTSISEKMNTEDNFKFINDYLEKVYPPIKANGGFVDKFIGDAIMALFHHTHDAIEAGVAMQKALSAYNLGRIQQSLTPIHTGIGLHRGKLTLGIIGVEYRMQGTVISDAVNIASRLESLTKTFGSALLVSQYVLGEDKDIYPHRFLGKVKVVGINQEIEIYEILSAENENIFEKKMASNPFYEQALKLYYNKNFAEASVQFTQSLKIYTEDKAAKLYLKNCALYMVNGVAENWTGAEIFTEK